MAQWNVAEVGGYLAFAAISAKLGWSLGSLVYRRLLARSLDVTKLGGKWALVTGATDGIGKAYAFALAKKGLNIVLVSRSPAKLKNVATELEQACPGILSKYAFATTLSLRNEYYRYSNHSHFRTVVVDFANDDAKDYIPKVEESIRDLDIGVLVNNVGMTHDPMEYHELGSAAVNNLINVNIVSMNNMTMIVLPQMVARKNGAVINIASVFGSIPGPLMTVYSSTKAYMDMFSRSLSKEYERYGITIQSILPGPVVSNMTCRTLKKPVLMAPSSEAFVSSALTRIGIDQRTTGYWVHDLMLMASECLPTRTVLNMSHNALSGLREQLLLEKQE